MGSYFKYLWPWIFSLSFHSGLAAVGFFVPRSTEAVAVPIVVEMKETPLPPKLKEPEPEPEPAAPPPPAEAKIAPRVKQPAPLEPEPPPEETPPKQQTPPNETDEPPPPPSFGIQMEGDTSAGNGPGLAVPIGDSLNVDHRQLRKNPAPAAPLKKSTSQRGFKGAYGRGEQAPLAVINVPPKVLKQVNVQYPERMKDLGIEGRVVLELTVSGEGKVIDTRVLRSLRAELDEVALKAARELLFSPATVNGTPVQVKIPYTFTFVLD